LDKDKLKIEQVPMKIEAIGDKEPEKTLERGCALLDRVGVKYWIASGTLLGLVRDKKFIAHDTDIDVECIEPEMFARIRRIFERNGFMPVRIMTYDGHVQQAAYTDDRNHDVVFDIYFYRLEGAEYVNYNDHGTLKLPRDIVKTIKDRKPEPPEAYLAWRYGDDWTIPTNKKSDWGEDTKCLKS